MSAATYGWVALGSAIGGVARFWLSNLLAHRWPGFPWGTIIVNVTGSLAIGLLAAMTAPGGRWHFDPHWTPFLMAGICGGYTTFSAFSLQTLALAPATAASSGSGQCPPERRALPGGGLARLPVGAISPTFA
jgi:CrcB protein